MKTITVALGVALVVLVGLGRMSAQSGYDLFQQALTAERADGNLAGALTLYRRVVSEFAGDRPLVARALVRLGDGYEKLGDPQARAVFERVVREFADQVESAAQARTRLAALREPSTGPPTMTTRRVRSPDQWKFGGSTDGRYLTYTESRTGHLAVHDLATSDSRRFANKGPSDPEDSGAWAEESVISPDGRQVAYAFCCAGATPGNYDVRLVPVTAAASGAPPRVLYSNENVSYVEVQDWSPDGKHILAAVATKDRSNQIVLIAAADGSARVLKTLDWRWPEARFSPDGRTIAYDIPLKPDSLDRDIFALAADGRRETTMVENPATDRVLGWAPDGRWLLFGSDRTGSPAAWALEVVEGRPQGSPVLIKADIGDMTPIGSTRSGALYYLLPTNPQDVYIASLDIAAGRVTVPPVPVNPRLLGGGKSSAAWSPDGEELAYVLDGVARIRSIGTDEERLLSNGVRVDTRFGRLHWSPDGRFLLATGTDRQRPGLYRIDARTGAADPLVRNDGGDARPSGVWSADGKAIVYALRNAIHVRDLETGQDREIYRPAVPSLIRKLALAPDGQWLTVASSRQIDRAGKPAIDLDVLVIPLTGGEPRTVVTLRTEYRFDEPDDLAALEWAPDGNHLLYSWNNELWTIPATGGDARKLELPSTTPWSASISVHPDGRRIAFTTGEPKDEVWVMENFWPAPGAAR